MAHFYFDLSDFLDAERTYTAISDNHRNSFGPLKTTAGEAGQPNLGTTSFGIADFMMGAAMHKSPALVADDFNQTISSDLSGMFKSEGGVEQVLGPGRGSLVPRDVKEREGFPDSIFEDASTAGSGEGAGNASGGGVPGANMEEAVEAILGNPNITFDNRDREAGYMRAGALKPNVLNGMWYFSQHYHINVSSTKRNGGGGSQHDIGQAVDINRIGPKDGNSLESVESNRHGPNVEGLYGVIDDMPSGFRPTGRGQVIGPYQYNGSNDIQWLGDSTMGDGTIPNHHHHIHVGWGEPGELGQSAPGGDDSGGGRSNARTASGKSTGQAASDLQHLRKFAEEVEELDSQYRNKCRQMYVNGYPRSRMPRVWHEIYMRSLRRIYDDYWFPWKWPNCTSSHGWLYNSFPPERPQTPCEKTQTSYGDSHRESTGADAQHRYDSHRPG